MVRFRHLALGGIALVGAGILTLCGKLDAFAADNISLSIDTTNISLDIVPRTAEGEFMESSNANISVSTTSTSGYTLSIASSTGSTELTNATDNTSKITSISNNLTNADFSSSSNTQYNNKWGYKPSQYVTMDGETPITHTNTGANAVFKPLPGQAGEILAVTDQANQTNMPDNYTISIGARANNQTAIGSYQSDSFVIMAVSNKGVVECDDTKLCVQFDGNGLVFPETNAQLERNVNNVNYDSSTTIIPDTKYSHTSNINDAGVQSGSYPNDLATKDVITILGASELSVTITYGTENNWDMLYVFQGEYTGTIGRNMDQASTGWLYKYMGGSDTTATVTITIPGDTATFGFYSDSSSQFYGYYAVVTALPVHSRTVTSGEYAIPIGTNPLFHGWSSTATTPGGGLPSDVEYADEADIKSHMPGDNGQTKVLYAVWQQGQEITFTKDSNVTSIDVLNAGGNTVGTITSSGQSLVLVRGDTYTLKPTHATGYTTNAITITSGAGTITGKQFAVGAGSATINFTSRQIPPMQNYSCSNLANIGDTDMVYDTRDSQVYLIGKLADGKCWLLDNLALDLTSSTVLSGMNENNTHASNTTLNYLKGITTRDPSTDPNGKYATAGVSNWTTSISNSAPLVNISNKDIIPSDATSTAGQYKVGGYYNFCAASAGSYCYGNGTSGGTSSGDATEDICPKGWRLPTGGSTGEYQALYNNASYNTYANYRSALHLPLSGGFTNGSAFVQGSNGYFWSSTRINDNYMYTLLLDTTDINLSYRGLRNYGRSVRCVLGS